MCSAQSESKGRLKFGFIAEFDVSQMEAKRISPVSEDLQPVKRSSSYELLPPDFSELRVVLLGNSWAERSSVGNFLLGETVFNTEEESDRCLRVSGQPELFSKKHKLRLCRVLQLFKHVSCDVFEDAGLMMAPRSKHIKPALNLVLCERRVAGKTSAAEAILGQRELPSVSNSSECVKHQGEVCGRRVSLVELPALCGKPQEEVMEESFSCISLCDPEGVHAFILVLPVGPLTDEDKGELETLQNTFGSRGNDFTLILSTVESDPTAPAVVNFLKKNKDLQELCQRCGGRHVVLNIKDQQQIPELLDAVQEMRGKRSRSFTMKMFHKAQMEKVVELENTNRRLKAELQDVKKKSQEGDVDESQNSECLRMVLFGKNGTDFWMIILNRVRSKPLRKN
ncbi:hypothetical protein NQZ68_012736 [Dissostichus eleginoides]|nr:hypothetical protein NQZ68_012736 [Dissostichus eleginoides]